MEQLAGKTILIIEGSYPGKIAVYETARKQQIKICLLDPNHDHFARDLVEHFFVYDCTDHSQDEKHAENIINLLSEKKIQVDACFPFWDDSLTLTAMVSNKLGLPGQDVEVIKHTASKFLTHRVLSEKTECSQFASPSYVVKTHEDIDEVAHKLVFPAFLKPEFGCCSCGATIVEDIEACHQHMRKLHNEAKDGFHIYGWNHAPSLVLMSYLDGPEYNVDVVIHGTSLLAAFPRRKGPAQEPFFLETSCVMPCLLNKSKKDELINAAFQSCIGIGLRNGTFNAEVKMTNAGPKLVEINARIGQEYVFEWYRRIYGVDIISCSLLFAFGIKPQLIINEPRTSMIGISLYSHYHSSKLMNGQLLHKLQQLHTSGAICYKQRVLNSDFVDHSDTAFTSNILVGQLSVQHENVKEAKKQLLEICEELKLSDENYPIEFLVNSLFQ